MLKRIKIYKEQTSLILKKHKNLHKILKLVYLLLSFQWKRALFYNMHFVRNSFDILLSAKKALDTEKVQFWLDFGTLLGVYREGDVIKDDLDMDISIYLSSYTDKIDQAFYREGFKLFRKIVIDEGKYGLEVSFIKNDIKIDIFCHSQFSSGFSKVHSFCGFPGLGETRSIIEKGGLQVVEQYLPLNGFKKVNFKGAEFFIPSNTEEYLAHHYGTDFRTPRKWDYTDTRNDNTNAEILDDKIGIVFTN